LEVLVLVTHSSSGVQLLVSVDFKWSPK
jgi:hypothetical protein